MTDLMVRPTAVDLVLAKVKPCYQQGALKFVQYLDENGLRLGDPQGWAAYQDHLDKRDMSASTYNNYMIAMKAVLKAALETAEARVSVAETNQIRHALDDLKLKKKAKPNITDKILTKAEVQCFLAELRKTQWGPNSDRARTDVALWVEFLWKTGCRVSEMTNAKWKHLKRTEAGFLLRLTKTKFNKQRDVPLDADLIERIKGFYRSETYLFESPNGGAGYEKDRRYTREHISQTIHALGKRVFPKKSFTAHTMRHSIAAHRVKNEPGRIKAISHWLGHSSVSITLDYYGHDYFTDAETLSAVSL